ncbi:hypothetical protein EVA_00897 [gut metagenome]|uniref:Uncharacterized protein n=1 Tax=gut metagenome TaxID=749906 RepID=J9H3Q4_9ZZZZ
MNFLTCLNNRKFCSRQHSSCNITQTSFLVLFLRMNQSTYRTFYQFHSPNQQTHITDIKNRVESRQFIRNSNICTTCIKESIYHPIDKLHKRMEDTQHPDYTKHIKNKMRQCSSLGLGIGGQSSQIGGYGCSDIFT